MSLFFKTLANYYDCFMEKNSLYKTEEICDFFGDSKTLRILDIAGGTGVNSDALSRLGHDISVADFSLQMLQVMGKNKRIGKPVCCSAEFLPFNNAFFDAVIMTDALHHFETPGKVICEIRRILNYSGFILIQEFYPDRLKTRCLMTRLLVSPQYLKWLRMFHRRFSGSPEYKIANIAKSVSNALKNDRMYLHDGFVMYSSFVPPLNSPSYESVVKNVITIDGDYFKGFTHANLKAPISMYVALTDKCMTILFTTGYGLTQKRADSMKKAGLFAVGISLDNIEAEKHDAKRGYKGAHRIALEAIEISRKAGLLTMGQLVCTRSLLKDNGLEKTALYMKSFGIQEIRLMEPMPCGELDKENEEILTPTEVEKIKEFHIRCNNDPKMPKVAAFPYFEDSSQFGCGAGSQHSYIDAKGNLYPCDFLPISFGNLFERPFDELWQEMHSITGGPRCACLSKQLGKKLSQFKENSYPLPPEISKKICSSCKKGKRPDYYTLAEKGKRVETQNVCKLLEGPARLS